MESPNGCEITDILMNDTKILHYSYITQHTQKSKWLVNSCPQYENKNCKFGGDRLRDYLYNIRIQKNLLNQTQNSQTIKKKKV